MQWKRVVLALIVLGASAAAAPAYTIVLRGGERIEIGEFYWLAGSTMSWVSPRGERRSIDLSSVNLDATAKQNGEAVSVFIDRAIRRGAVVTSQVADASPRAETETEPLTITTADLAPLRDERERAEAERRIPSVLPPLGAPREETPSEDTAATEERWREEARQLREQLDVEQAQIDALFAELAYREANPRKFRLSNEYNYGRGAVVVDHRGIYRYPAGGYTTGSTYNRADDEFAQLNSRLIDLEIVHRGTLSRWDAFLERARRAGVPPGWLRD